MQIKWKYLNILLVNHIWILVLINIEVFLDMPQEKINSTNLRSPNNILNRSPILYQKLNICAGYKQTHRKKSKKKFSEARTFLLASMNNQSCLKMMKQRFYSRLRGKDIKLCHEPSMNSLCYSLLTVNINK